MIWTSHKPIFYLQQNTEYKIQNETNYYFMNYIGLF